jgi:hypothetical protein
MNEHRRRSGVIGTPAAVTILSTGVCASEAHGDGRIPGLNPDDLIRQRVSLTWAGRSVYYGGDLRALVAVKSPGVRHSLGVAADARWSGILVDHSLRGNGFGVPPVMRFLGRTSIQFHRFVGQFSFGRTGAYQAKGKA